MVVGGLASPLRRELRHVVHRLAVHPGRQLARHLLGSRPGHLANVVHRAQLRFTSAGGILILHHRHGLSFSSGMAGILSSSISPQCLRPGLPRIRRTVIEEPLLSEDEFIDETTDDLG